MKKVRPIIIGLIIISLSIYGIHYYFGQEKPDTIEASGTIEATQVKVSAKLAGTVEEVNVKEGDSILADDILVKLTRTDLVLQRERDLLNIELAQAKLRDLQAGARPQELQEAYANLTIAQESLVKDKTDLERIEKLYEQGAASLQELEGAQLKVDLAQNKLDIAQAKVDLINAGPRAGAVEAAVIELNRMEAILKATDNVLVDLIVKSPLNGTVLSRNYEVGEFAPQGTRLFTIANLSDLWITVYIPSDQLSQISLGQKVECSVSGDSNIYNGEVIHLADQGEFTPKMIQTKKERANIVFAIKVAVENLEGRLKPGMPADVVFKRGE